MQVTFKTLTNATFKIELAPTDTVSALDRKQKKMQKKIIFFSIFVSKHTKQDQGSERKDPCEQGRGLPRRKPEADSSRQGARGRQDCRRVLDQRSQQHCMLCH